VSAEEWRPVFGHDARYEVSNLGRIKSLPRRVKFGNQFRTTNLKILKLNDNGKGYKYVTVERNKNKYVHIAVAESFIGQIPAGFEVNHKDGCAA
jgi:hypothetical protein